MQEKTTLAEKIAEAIFEMIEKERGLVKSRLVETIATILSAQPKEAQAYERMKKTLFENSKPYPVVVTADQIKALFEGFDQRQREQEAFRVPSTIGV
jgi:endonuclease III